MEFRRRCSFLFQSNALFDSLTAMENVALPLEQTTDLPDREIRERAREALRQLELEKHVSHYPAQLSGGMQNGSPSLGRSSPGRNSSFSTNPRPDSTRSEETRYLR